MRFFSFHLMPYIGLDPSYDGPAWVTCPNQLFDPVHGGALYNRYLDELLYAEELGFDGVCVNEHHQNAYGHMPSPNLMASIARPPDHPDEGRGRRQRAAALRPPDAGGRGVRHDRLHQRRSPHRRDGRRRRPRVLLVLGQPGVRPGALPGGPRPHPEGVDDARPVRVGQQALPHPVREPVAAARSSSPTPRSGSPAPGRSRRWSSSPSTATPTWASRTSSSTCSSARSGMFRDACAAEGYEADPLQAGWLVPIYVAETDAQARREYEEHLWYFVKRLLPGITIQPPGYTSARSLANILKGAGTFMLNVDRLGRDRRRALRDRRLARDGHRAARRGARPARHREPPRALPDREPARRPDAPEPRAVRPGGQAARSSAEFPGGRAGLPPDGGRGLMAALHEEFVDAPVGKIQVFRGGSGAPLVYLHSAGGEAHGPRRARGPRGALRGARADLPRVRRVGGHRGDRRHGRRGLPSPRPVGALRARPRRASSAPRSAAGWRSSWRSATRSVSRAWCS